MVLANFASGMMLRTLVGFALNYAETKKREESFLTTKARVASTNDLEVVVRRHGEVGVNE